VEAGQATGAGECAILKAAAAKQDGAAGPHPKRPFEIDLHVRIESERARDVVLRNVVGNFGAGRLRRRSHFPYDAVIERQLLEPIAAQSVHAAIADMPAHRSLRQKNEHARRGSHPFEIGIVRAALEDPTVPFGQRRLQRHRRGGVGLFEVLERNRVDRDLAGEFAGRVSAHAVGDHEQMTAAKEIDFGAGQHAGLRVMVVGAP